MGKAENKISIVVAIYDVEEYLEKCIQSLCDQTYKNIEIVLVVRDSGDRCVEICEAYKVEDNRIVIVHQTGRGLVNARKEGTLAATGEYVIHIDGDDWVDADWLENAAGYLEDHEPSMIYMNGMVREGGVMRHGDVQEKCYEGEGVYDIFPMFLRTDCFVCGEIRWSVWSWIVKREILLQQQMLIEDKVWLAEDAVYVFLCLLKAKSVMFLHTGNYHYVMRENSGMHTEMSIKNGNLEMVYKLLRDNFQKCGVFDKLNRFLNVFTCYVICYWEYRFFSSQFKEFLFPYTKVKAGSKVVVYGAGIFGRQVVQVLTERKEYPLVMWVDQNVNKAPCGEWKVREVGEALNTEYDYIIVAVLFWKVAMEIKKNLVEMGVSAEKIALMDVDSITEDKIPW